MRFIKISIIAVCVSILLSLSQIACAGNYSVNFKSQQSSISDLWPSNVVRHFWFFGKNIDSFGAGYGPDFAAMGAKYQEIFIDNAAMDATSPLAGTYDFAKLDATIDDDLSMGFKPFIRYGVPPSWIAPDQVAMLNDPLLQAKTITVFSDITKHLADKYGIQTRNWAFSSLNEMCLCDTRLGATAAGDYSKSTQKIADYYYAFANQLHSIDSNLRVSGGPESTDNDPAFSLWYYVNYLVATGQKSKLAAFNFLDFHHYGYLLSDTNGATDAIFDNIFYAPSNVKKTKDLLAANGFGNLEIWESERYFSSYGEADETRNSSTIGGTWLALDAVENAFRGVNMFFIWYELGYQGLRGWPDQPLNPAYYGMDALYNAVGFNSSATFYGSSSDTGTINVYGIKNAAGQNFVLAFNRRSVADAGNFTITLPDDFSSAAAAIHVYKYSANRIADAPNEFAAIGPLAVQLSGGNKTISFSQSIDPYSMYAFRVEGVLAAKKADLNTCVAAGECQSNICLDGYCGLKPDGWGCGSGSVCKSNNCQAGKCVTLPTQITISGTVKKNTGQGIGGATIDFCGSNGTATTDSAGNWSKTLNTGDSYCARVSAGLPSGYSSIRATGNNTCHFGSPTYEWQYAGQNKFQSCPAANEGSWDLASDTGLGFIVDYPACVPKTCAALNYGCGSADDGCGATLQCGTCSTGQSCSDNTCASSCVAKTCASLGYSCGSQSDGCGGALDCGTCASGKTCSIGVCVAAGSGGGGGGSSGGGGNTNPLVQPVATKPVSKMSRADILAAIAKIQALIADLQKQLAALGGSTTTFSCTQITKNLFYGMANDPQIKCLQEVLKSQGYAVGVSGNYDAATKIAVTLFQQKYAGEILAPYNLTRGSGNVGNATLGKINQVIKSY